METLKDLLTKYGQELLEGHGIRRSNISASNIKNLSIDEVYKIELLIGLYKRFSTSMELEAFIKKAEVEPEEVDEDEILENALSEYGFDFYHTVACVNKMETLSELFNQFSDDWSLKQHINSIDTD